VPVGLLLVFGLPISATGRVLAVILIGTLAGVAAMAVSRLTRNAGRFRFNGPDRARVGQREPVGDLGVPVRRLFGSA
jgi:hypothetical protein